MSAQIHEWYRFLDAHSDDEATCELRRHAGRLEVICQDLEEAARPLVYCPDGSVEDCLRIARTTLSESIAVLNETLARFRAGERHTV